MRNRSKSKGCAEWMGKIEFCLEEHSQTRQIFVSIDEIIIVTTL